MRILQVTPYYEPEFQLGGIVRSTSILCRQLVELGHDVTVYATQSAAVRERAPLHAAVDVGGVQVVYFRNVLRGFGFGPAMIAAARHVGRFEIVHVAAFWQFFGLPVLLAGIRGGVPTVVSPRGSLVMVHDRQRRSLKHRAFYWAINHPILERVSAIHFTAENERADALRLGLGTPSFRVPNALPVEEFAELPDRTSARRDLGIDPGGSVVLFLGRLDRRKALDLLVRAFAQQTGGRADALLILAGPDYGEEAMLRRLVAELKLRDRVRFTGLVDARERARLFAAADLCVLTSHAENFGNAAGEAMAAGLPVLVSDSCGIAEHVAEYDAGRVVPVDVDAIAAGIGALLANMTLLPELGRNARRLVTERYAARAVATTMARAYQDLLTGGRSAECFWTP